MIWNIKWPEKSYFLVIVDHFTNILIKLTAQNETKLAVFILKRVNVLC